MVVIAQLLRRQEVLERQHMEPVQAVPAISWKIVAPCAAVFLALLSWGGLKLVSHGEILAGMTVLVKTTTEAVDKLRLDQRALPSLQAEVTRLLPEVQRIVSTLEQRSSDRAGQNRDQIDRLNQTLIELMRRLGTPIPPALPDDPNDWPFR